MSFGMEKVNFHRPNKKVFASKRKIVNWKMCTLPRVKYY